MKPFWQSGARNFIHQRPPSLPVGVAPTLNRVVGRNSGKTLDTHHPWASAAGGRGGVALPWIFKHGTNIVDRG